MRSCVLTFIFHVILVAGSIDVTSASVSQKRRLLISEGVVFKQEYQVREHTKLEWRLKGRVRR